jgi:AraC-like DNA-binding protein
MQDQMNELRALVCKHVPNADGHLPVPRLQVHVGACTTRPLPAMYEPMLCFVLQGAKRVSFGDRTIEYRGASFLIASVDLPATGQVVQASADEPYIAMALALDPASVAAILLDMPARDGGQPARGLEISPLTADVVDPLLRLCRLLEAPDDIAVMAPMLEREILYRILLGPQGAMLRQIARSDSRLSQIRRAVDWIRRNFAEPLRVDALADMAGMSASSFHRHFKAVTAMSPLQYQKQIRLQEARRRLLGTPGEAARVAFSVGYESPSQFSREYARQFGLPPIRDAARLRQGGALEDA